MAKGDADAVKSNIGNLQNQNNAGWSDIRNTWAGQMPGPQGRMDSNLNTATAGYGNVWAGGATGATTAPSMAGYSSFAGGSGDLNQGISDFNSVFGQGQNFAQTGGFSQGDLENIRQRAMQPLVGTYQNAADELQRQASLSGGYSANLPAATAQLTRNLGEQTRQQSLDTEGSIAQMVQQGKLAGMGVEQGAAQGATNAQAISDQMRLAGLGGMTQNEITNLQAELSGAGGMLSAAGLDANTLNQLRGLYQGTFQNQMGTNLGLSGQSIQATQIPGDFSQAMGNIGSVLGLGGTIGGALSGLRIGGGGSSLPSGGFTGMSGGMGSYANISPWQYSYSGGSGAGAQ